MSSSLKSKAISSLIWKFLERCGYQGVQLVVQIVLARLLLPSDFGLIAILLVFINLSNVFVQSGLNTAIIQAKTLGKKACSSVFWLSLLISLLLYVALFVAAPFVAAFYQISELDIALKVLGLLLFINSYNSVQVAIASRELKFKKIFFATVAAVLSSGAVALALAYFNFGYWALVAQQLIYQGVSCLSLAVLIDWKPRLEFDLVELKHLFSFGWKICATSLIDTIYLSAFDLVIGKAFSSEMLGYYSQGKKYPATANALVDGSIQSVMLSVSSKISSDLARTRSLMRRSLSVSSYIVVPVMFCLALIAPVLVPVLLTEKWLPAVLVMQLFCVYYSIQPIQTTNVQVISSLGRSDVVLKIDVIKRVAGLAILLVFAFVFKSIYAVTFGLVIDAVICVFVNAISTGSLLGFGLKEQLLQIVPSYILSGCLFFVLTLAGACITNELLRMALQVALFFPVYFFVSKMLKLYGYRCINDAVLEMRNKGGKTALSSGKDND